MLAVLAAGCVNEDRELAVGDVLAVRINSYLPLVRDTAATGYLRRLGERLAAESERPHLPYRFYLIDSEGVNAFALPGGHVYLTRGLAARTSGPAELAGVLAHEIGHVAARHGAERLERELRTGSVVSSLYGLLFGREPELFEQRALKLGSRAWSASHSRTDELEADRSAVGYLLAAGFRPEALVTFLDTLIQEGRAAPSTPLASWFSSHPTSGERLRRLRRALDSGELAAPRPRPGDELAYRRFVLRLRALPPPPDSVALPRI